MGDGCLFRSSVAHLYRLLLYHRNSKCQHTITRQYFFKFPLSIKLRTRFGFKSVNRPCKTLSFCRHPYRNFDKHMVYFYFSDIFNGVILFILRHIIRFLKYPGCTLHIMQSPQDGVLSCAQCWDRQEEYLFLPATPIPAVRSHVLSEPQLLSCFFHSTPFLLFSPQGGQRARWRWRRRGARWNR